MAEENPNARNLDLNLGPLDDDGAELGSGSYPNGSVNLEEWLESPAPRFREGVRVSHRSQRWRSLWRQLPIPPETRDLALESIDGNTQQAGEASLVTEERPAELAKMCKNGNGDAEDESLGKDDARKNNGEEGSFFGCNICLDLAKDPVVTCCGHLFCWPCLYRWLHLHSDAKECPVCKGEVTAKNVTPINGRGRGKNAQELNADCSMKIPPRPQAQWVESVRQTIRRTAFMPMEEMIRRLGNSFDLSRGLAELQAIRADNPVSPERHILNRILTSRAMRGDQTSQPLSDGSINLTEGIPPNYEARDNRRLSSGLLRRTDSIRPAVLQAVLNSDERLAAERLVESYFHSNPVERSQEPPPPFDDRDSVSSIAAVIHSESQTLDNADSTVALSTSSSRRRNDASRISDVDSGESRVPRRRRLN